MALLEFDPVYGVLICTRCCYTVPQAFIVAHLREYHRQDVSPAERQAYAKSFDALPIRPPKEVAQIQRLPYTPPISYLTLYKDGWCCQLCDNRRPYIVRSKPTMVQHLKHAHNCRRRNGIQLLVTFCHKRYSVSGSTKIIHRYLPQNVSTLLVYYLWLVQPFCQQLRLLALDQKVEPPSFLWARITKSGIVPWSSLRLTNVLRQEFKHGLDTEAAILLWRHAAIAISRRHLRCAPFNNDYGTESRPTVYDNQTTHGGILAGNVYARGIEEAPGHVAVAQAEYRQISREWHTFLGIAGAEQNLGKGDGTGTVALSSQAPGQRLATDSLPSSQRLANGSPTPTQRPATGPPAFTQQPAAESPQAPPLRVQKFAPKPVPKNQPSANLMICMNIEF